MSNHSSFLLSKIKYSIKISYSYCDRLLLLNLEENSKEMS